MVPTWLQKARKSKSRSLHRDQPPIRVTAASSFVPPVCSFAKISLFQREVSKHGGSLVRFGLSQEDDVLHLAMLTPVSQEYTATAFLRIAEQAWLQMNLAHPQWSRALDAISGWSRELQKALLDLGRGTLCGSLQGVTIHHAQQTAAIHLRSLSPLFVIKSSGKIEVITPNDQHGLVGSLQDSEHSPITISTSDVRAIVITSDDFQPDHVPKAIQRILDIPYPLLGAAELLYFELRKNSDGSTVIWIELDPSRK